MSKSMFRITILIGAGSVDTDSFLSLFNANQSLIAVDGGANHLKKLGIIPNKIIGDLDSLDDKVYWQGKTEVVEIEDQNSTDLEKVLDTINAELYLAFGFAGDRFDHTLEILHVLSKYQNKKIIFFVGSDIIFRLPKTWRVKLPIGTRISLYPLDETKLIKSSGLHWPVDGLSMQQGHLIGTSNKTTSSLVEIKQKTANLVCVTNAEFCDKIMETLI